jgi:hypothetical protein
MADKIFLISKHDFNPLVLKEGEADFRFVTVETRLAEGKLIMIMTCEVILPAIDPNRVTMLSFGSEEAAEDAPS